MLVCVRECVSVRHHLKILYRTPLYEVRSIYLH